MLLCTLFDGEIHIANQAGFTLCFFKVLNVGCFTSSLEIYPTFSHVGHKPQDALVPSLICDVSVRNVCDDWSSLMQTKHSQTREGKLNTGMIDDMCRGAASGWGK